MGGSQIYSVISRETRDRSTGPIRDNGSKEISLGGKIGGFKTHSFRTFLYDTTEMSYLLSTIFTVHRNHRVLESTDCLNPQETIAPSHLSTPAEFKITTGCSALLTLSLSSATSRFCKDDFEESFRNRLFRVKIVRCFPNPKPQIRTQDRVLHAQHPCSNTGIS